MPVPHQTSQLIAFHLWLINKPHNLSFELSALVPELFTSKILHKIQSKAEDLCKPIQSEPRRKKQAAQAEPTMLTRSAKRLKASHPTPAEACASTSKDFIFENQADYNNFVKFLNFFETAYAKQDTDSTPSPYRVALDYLVAYPPLAEEHPDKLAQLLKQLLISSTQEALDFYSTDKIEDFICESSVVGWPLVQVMFDYYLEKTTLTLGEIPNPLGLVLLFLDTSIDNPEQMAAFIVWLLNKGVSTEDIISSRILDKFFEYHCSLLDPENYPLSPLYRLYAILKNNGAEALVALAETTPVINSEIEETDTPLRGYEKYTLTSVINPSPIIPTDIPTDLALETAGTLLVETYEDGLEENLVDILTLSSEMTPMETEVNLSEIPKHIVRKTARFEVPYYHNFEAYYTSFGQPYLHWLLRFYAKSPNEPQKLYLQSIFNDTSPCGLKTLSNLLIVLNKTTLGQGLFKTINALLNPSTIDHYIAANNFSIFYLVPTNLQLINKLNPEILEKYLAKLDVSEEYTFENLALLNTILTYFQNKQRDSLSITLIFEKMLILMMADPTLYYPEIIDRLRYQTLYDRYKPNYGSIIESCKLITVRKAHELENMLLQHLASIDFSPSSINDLMDNWSKLIKQLILLLEINSQLIVSFPTQKYLLHVTIIGVAWSKSPEASLLATLMNILTPVKPAEEVSEQETALQSLSEYERLLIEILLTLDQAELRIATINLLSTPPCSNPKWFNQLYAGTPIFELALQRDNIGLANYLMSISSDFSIPALSNALNAAIHYKNITYIEKFLEMTGDNKPSATAVDKALIYILENWEITPLPFFFLRMKDTNKPSPENVNSILNWAISRQQSEVVIECLKMTGTNKPNQDNVNRTLYWAISRQQSEVVIECLKMTGANKPDQINVDDALNSLLHNLESWHVLSIEFKILEQFLAMTEDNQPSQPCKETTRVVMTSFLLNKSSGTTPFHEGAATNIKVLNRLMPSIIPASILCAGLLTENSAGLTPIQILHMTFGSTQTSHQPSPQRLADEVSSIAHSKERNLLLQHTKNTAHETINTNNSSQLLYQIYLNHNQSEPVCRGFIEKCLKLLAYEAKHPEALMALVLIADREGDMAAKEAYRLSIIQGAAPGLKFFTQADPVCLALVSGTLLTPDKDTRNVSSFIEAFNTDIRRVFVVPVSEIAAPAVLASEENLAYAEEEEDLGYQIRIHD